jgi:osmoprotectant transport system substrate-binding protein/osmoprotectant transport system permease protein
VNEALAELPRLATAHLQLSLAGLGLALALSLPLGVLASRRPRLAAGALGTASVIQTIPSLALLAIMVPLLATIGFLPAWIALTLYAALPILRNTVTGLQAVPPELCEAAQGVGMTPAQQLRRVELPLAAPVIVAGVRTAAVWTVGTATLSTPVGAPSLGNLIFAGLQTRNGSAVVVGCLGAAGLALALDFSIGMLERGVRERNRARRALALLLLAVFLGWAGGSLAAAGLARERTPIRIGTKPFTEQYVLGELLSSWLERETGLPCETLQNLGSTVLFDALEQGEIDAYVDYSGTLWATILKRAGPPPARAQVLADVTQGLAQKYGIRVAAVLGFENTYALAMRNEEAAALRVRRISDLVARAPSLEIAGDYEWFQRAEWRALVATYGLAFRATRTMDPTLLYGALAEGAVDVISAYSTDGRITAYDLVLLEDDRGVIPPYDALVLTSARLQVRAPAVVAALARLDGAIDAAAMQRMNLAVDRDGRTPREVVREFLDAPR